MLKKENPATRMRHKLLRTAMDLSVSWNTMAKITSYMDGKTEREKEVIAEKLYKIVSESSTEEEMLRKAQETFEQTV